jgi:hypothetical protein
VALATVGLAALLLARYSQFSFQSSYLGEPWQLDQFRVGAAIYLGCFILGYNYDYRLVFLIFTVPLMLYWLKHASGFLKYLAATALASLVVTVWISRWSTFVPMFSLSDKYFFWDEILNWFLFFFCSYGFLITLPAWLRSLFAPRLLGVHQSTHQEGALSIS